MKIVKAIAVVVAALLILIGAIWILQGVNILPGSFMTGDIQWAYRGGAAALIGAVMLIWIARGRKSSGQ